MRLGALRKAFVPLVALALVISCVEEQKPTVDRPLFPDWILQAPDGHSVALADVIHDGPTILLFWATWCPYCKALMPHMQSLLDEYTPEYPLRIIAINFRDDGDPVAFMEEYGYTFELLLDGNEVAELYEVWGTPGLIILDKEGRIAFNIYDYMAELKATEDPTINEMKHYHRASRRAPKWAARIRQELDEFYATQ